MIPSKKVCSICLIPWIVPWKAISDAAIIEAPVATLAAIDTLSGTDDMDAAATTVLSGEFSAEEHANEARMNESATTRTVHGCLLHSAKRDGFDAPSIEAALQTQGLEPLTVLMTAAIFGDDCRQLSSFFATAAKFQSPIRA